MIAAMCVKRSIPALSLLVVWVIAVSSGCHDAGEGANGAACVADGECQSGFCWAGCREADGDEDGDGLSNHIERRLGLNPTDADSDGDGLLDGDELGPGGVEAPRDSDGDGIIDALESAVADADGDCLPDSLDASSAPATAETIAEVMCKRAGVCAGGDVVARCELGPAGARLTCEYAGVAAYEPREVSCDGLDNDCDGEVDEGLVYVESTGALRVLGDACVGLGECRELVGVVECAASGAVVCSVDRDGSQSRGAADDIDCDGLDNDCDGEVDEGVTWLEPDTGLVRRFGEACRARGVCGLVAGVVECAADGRGLCSTEPGGSQDRSGPERCDGLDEDCNGRVDDGVGWRDPAGGPLLSVGEPCGRGVCAGTVVACAGGIAVCPGLEAAGEERCNGLDDDCDGETDEAVDVVRGCPLQGECAGREVLGACEDGALVCRYRRGEVFEVAAEADRRCDGLDEDCDGLTDEDVVTGDGAQKGDACFGSGLCATVGGFYVCAGGGLVCSADAGLAEVCDGVDNDCDGVTDEEPVDRPACVSEGVCAWAEGEARCEGGAWLCPYDELDERREVERADEDCDGLDNDCDGVVDEGSRRQPSGALERLWEAPGAPRAGATAAGEGLWVQGGVGEDMETLGALWRFDGERWERRAEGPALAGHGLAFDEAGGRLFAQGGFERAEVWDAALGADGAPSGALWMYEAARDVWQEVAPAGEVRGLARRHHALVVLPDGRLVMHGGLVEGEAPEVLVGTLVGEGAGVACRWAPLDVDAGWRVGHAGAAYTAAGAVWVVLAGGEGSPSGWAAFTLAGDAWFGPAGGPAGLTRPGLLVEAGAVVALAERSSRLTVLGEGARVGFAATELGAGPARPVVAGWSGGAALGLSLAQGEVFEVTRSGLTPRPELDWPVARREATLLVGGAPAVRGAARASGAALWLLGGAREHDGVQLTEGWAWRLPLGPWVRVGEVPAGAVFAAGEQAIWAARPEASGVALWRLPLGGEAPWHVVPAGGVGPVAVAALAAAQLGEEASVYSAAPAAGGLVFHEARIGADGSAVWGARGEWAGAAGAFVLGASAGGVRVAATVDGAVWVRALGRAGLGEAELVVEAAPSLACGAWDPTRAALYVGAEGVVHTLEVGALRQSAVPGLAAEALVHGPDGALWALGAGLARVPLGCD